MSSRRDGSSRSRSTRPDQSTASSQRTAVDDGRGGDRSRSRTRSKSSKSRKEDSPVKSDDTPAGDSPPDDPFPNYNYPDRSFLAILILFFEFVTWILLLVVCISPPNGMSGGTSVLRDSTSGEFIGVLRESMNQADRVCAPR